MSLHLDIVHKHTQVWRQLKMLDRDKHDLCFVLHDGQNVFAYLLFDRQPHRVWPRSKFITNLLWWQWERTLSLTVIPMQFMSHSDQVDLPYYCLSDIVHQAFKKKFGEPLLGIVYSGKINQQLLYDLRLVRNISRDDWLFSRVVDIDLAILYDRMTMFSIELTPEKIRSGLSAGIHSSL